MRITFYYVRHGQTLFNILGRLQGWCDSPLSEQGIRDAEKAEAALRDVPFDRAFSSSSLRAVKTAEIILQRHNALLRTEDDLREFDYGMLDGTKISELSEESLKERRRTGSWKDAGGEDTEDVCRRIRGAFDRIARQCRSGDKVLIVSHGTYGLFLMQELLGVDLKAYSLHCTERESVMFPNCGIMRFAYEDGRWILTQYPVKPEEYREGE